MKCSELILASFIFIACNASYAVNLRGLDIEAPCDSISEHEAKLGSVHVESVNFPYIYKDKYLNKDAQIRYRCKGEKVTGQYLHIKLSDKDEANAIYKKLKTKIINQYDKPVFDYDELSLFRKLLLKINGDTSSGQKFATWDMGDYTLLTSIELIERRKSSYWHVSVSIAPSISQYKIVRYNKELNSTPKSGAN